MHPGKVKKESICLKRVSWRSAKTEETLSTSVDEQTDLIMESSQGLKHRGLSLQGFMFFGQETLTICRERTEDSDCHRHRHIWNNFFIIYCCYREASLWAFPIGLFIDLFNIHKVHLIWKRDFDFFSCTLQKKKKIWNGSIPKNPKHYCARCNLMIRAFLQDL